MNLIGAIISASIILATNPVVAEQSSFSSQNHKLDRTISTAPSNLKAGINRVEFLSEGEKMVGNLYLPSSYKLGDKLPVAIVTGSWTTVKEQMSGLYAQKLSEQGYAVLTFDFRNFGESGGKARNFESPANKIADIKNAVTFLRTLKAVDRERIAGLGICASAGYMAIATAQDPRIKTFIAIAPWLHNPNLVQLVYGGESGVNQRLAAAKIAKNKFIQTGEVETVPAISTTNSQAAMFGDFDYYLNPKRGAIPQWSNGFAVMSWAEWLTFNAMPQAKNIKVPTLFIHSENAAIPDGAKQFFAAIPTAKKQIIWLPKATQFDFYDQLPVVNQSISLTVKHLKASL